MASALIKEIRDDFLTCQICLDTFKKPKILDCLHSYCEECLKEYIKPAWYVKTNVKCPTCKRDTALKQNGVPGLKDNFFILNLVETVVARKKAQHSVDKIPCDSCAGKGGVVSRCMTCSDFLCRSCVASHRTLKVFKGHVVVTLDELRSGKYDGQTEKKEPTCDVHTGEKMRFYCKTHSVPICRDCTVLDHTKPDHNVVNLTEVVDELRSSSQQALKDLREALSSTENDLVAAERAIVDIQTESKKAEQLVDEKVSHLVTLVKKLGEECKEKVKANCGREEKQKCAEKEEMELDKVRLTSTAEFTESLLSHGTDIELATASNQIRRCRDELCRQSLDKVLDRWNMYSAYTRASRQHFRGKAGGSTRVLQDTEEWEKLLSVSDCIEDVSSTQQVQARKRHCTTWPR